MGAKIDLRKAHLTRKHGDILAVFSWINDQRALFLIPHLRVGAPWFIVLEPAAHEWNDHDPAGVRLLAQRSMKACEVLGIEPTPTNANRIISIVNDALPDLVTMPSAPAKEYHAGTFGQLVLRQDGRVLGGEEIRFAREGATYG